MSLPGRRLLSGLLVLLLVLLVTLAWLAGTESGLRLLWRQLVAPALPELSAGTVQGRLAGTIRLDDVHYETDGLLIAARSLRLDWAPAALLNGLLRIRTLAAEGVRYEQRGAGDGEPLVLPERIGLPLAIEVLDLSIHDLVVISAPQAEPLPFDAVTLAGAYRGARLEIGRLTLRRPSLALDGTLTLQTAADYPLSGAVHWQASVPDQAPLTAQVRLSGNLHALRIEQTLPAPYAARLDLTLTEPLAELQLDGALTLQDSDLAAINAAWPAMHLAGTVTARGPPGALRLNGTVAVQDPVAGALQLVFAGDLQPDALQLEVLRLTSGERPTRLEAQGRIGFGTQPVFDFKAQWHGLAWPLDGVPDYESNKGSFTLTGTPNAYRLDARGDLKLRDVLAGQLALQARSAGTPGNWQVEAASLSAGASRIELAGQVGSVNDLTWRVHAPRLGDLSPQASGRLNGNGTFKGALPDPAIQVRASGANIGFRDYRLGAVDIDAAIDLAAGQTSRLQADISAAVLAGTRVTRLTVKGSGSTARHSVHLVADTERGNADLTLTGHWDGSTWKFDVQQASLAWPQLASWQLAQPVSGELTRERLQLPEHCWVHEAARVCVRVAGSVDDYNGAFTLAALPLAYFSAQLPERVSLDGELNGRGDFSRVSTQAATVNVRLDSSTVNLHLPQADTEQPQLFTFAPGQAVLTLANRKAALSVELPFAAGEGGLHAQAGLVVPPDGNWQQGRVNGELSLQWPDIGLVARWIPEVGELHGRIDGRVQLDGTLAAPGLQGRLALTGGTATLVTPGLTLEDVSVELAGQPAGDIRVTASVRSGGGTLHGDGFLNPVERSATIALQGTLFQVMNTSEAKIYASPELQLAMDTEQTRITGRIDIPRAQLRPRKPPPSAVSVSPDQVIVIEDGQGRASARYPVNTRVRLVLGDAVDIDGLGLTGKLHGDVQLVDQPGQPARASGELSISDGRYEAYGQELTIRTGRLLFAGGAVTEPGLDIEAVRKPAPDVLVGIKARGRLRAPEFTVFSEPVLPQSAQLSWLVLGRPLEGGASDSERSALQTAALMLGLSGGESIGKRLGEQLGLDEVSVNREPGADVTQASLLVGKYLTPDLFVSYGIGLFDPVATLRLRYALSSHWKLVGEAAALNSSADLFYVIERKKK